MCNCKTELEAKLTERFAGQHRTATGHRVELAGYGFAVIGNTMTLLPFMEARASANFPLKKGGAKYRTVRQKMAFSFCPFCGGRIATSEPARAST